MPSFSFRRLDGLWPPGARLLAPVTLLLLTLLTGCADTEPALPTVTIRALDLRYEPQHVTIPRDQPVRIVLQNDGVLAHDISVEQLEVQVQQLQGEWVRARSTYTQSGDSASRSPCKPRPRAPTISYPPYPATRRPVCAERSP